MFENIKEGIGNIISMVGRTLKMSPSDFRFLVIQWNTNLGIAVKGFDFCRSLKQGDYPELSRWAQCDCVSF